MARKPTGVIALEIEKYEAKIKEFQDYLELNQIKDAYFETEQDKHKEIDTQIKMMNALPNWLLSLKQLKEDAKDKPIELRGGAQINDVAKMIMNKNKNE